MLSDRFRSMWTFYQFLDGVLKHLGDGPLQYRYDFQGLHRRVQQLVHLIGVDPDPSSLPELEKIERELDRIHRELSRIDSGYPPSVLRRFFDHIKSQDEKVLTALTKFYMLHRRFEQDTLDKLDILCTRLAEVGSEGETAIPRQPEELLRVFTKLAEFADLPSLPAAEMDPLEAAITSIREELRSIREYDELISSQVYDRYRRLKQRLGKNVLQPRLLSAATLTNIAAKNVFQKLARSEEQEVMRNTARIHDIEAYIGQHPELADEGLRGQLEEFRHFQSRFEAARQTDNVKRDDITELIRSMREVMARFEATAQTSDESTRAADHGSAEGLAAGHVGSRREPVSLTEILAPDPLLSESLHKIMSALELVIWDRPPEQVMQAPEVRGLDLEQWEITAYRWLSENSSEADSPTGELHRFLLTSAALRLKMVGESSTMAGLENSDDADRLFEVLERSAQSLERAGDVDRRFQWYIEDMVFRGDSRNLEKVYRSRFRFLHVYSGLWLDHQRNGGLTPL